MLNNTSTRKNEYEERAIVFLDFLGFSSIVEKSVNSKEELAGLISILNHIVNYMNTANEEKAFAKVNSQNGSEYLTQKDLNQKAKPKSKKDARNFREVVKKFKLDQPSNTKFDSLKDRRVTTFSDSVIISYPIDCMYALLLEVWYLTCAISESGYLVRGGITSGKLYHNNKIVFGPAMNRAYYLESKVASVPRIILEQGYLEKANKCGFKDEHYPFIKELKCIQKDSDDYNFINIFSPVTSGGFEKLKDRIKNDLDEINLKIHNLKDDEASKAKNIQKKLNWVQALLEKNIPKHVN